MGDRQLEDRPDGTKPITLGRVKVTRQTARKVLGVALINAEDQLSLSRQREDGGHASAAGIGRNGGATSLSACWFRCLLLANMATAILLRDLGPFSLLMPPPHRVPG